VLDALLSPLQIGPVELRNRIVSTAHQTTLVHDHLPTDDFLAYHEARARGGVGLIVLEATAVDPSGLLTPHTLAGYRDDSAAGFARLVDAVRPHGARLFVQLFHGGREQIASPPRTPAISASAVPSRRFHVEPRAATAADIEAFIEGYGRSAATMAEAGLDGIEISAAHNYLAAQFFTPGLNRRDDEWAEPAHFLLAVLDAVRAAAPGLALGVRLSADSEAAREVVGELVDRVDYLSVALGESSTYLGAMGIVPPPPFPENAIGDYAGFRVGPPLVGTSRIVDPVSADRLVAGGAFEAVGMTRALITDPDLPRKAAEGDVDEILRCIGCNACIAHYHAGTPIACTQNPRTGRERTLPRPGQAAERHRVVVVGAGPGGLAAAAEAGAAGHEVVLLERAERIGGQFALAGSAPMHEEPALSLARNYERLLAAGEVDLRLGTEADPDAVAALEPDLVVVATGARPFVPDVPLEGVTAIQSWDVLAGPLPTGRKVVVADWGGDASGLASAELLARAGNEVALAVGSATLGETLHQYQRNLYAQRLYRARVEILHHLDLLAAESGAVRFANLFAPDLETTLPADLLVLALGRVPERGLGEELAARGLPVKEVGDCLSPRSAEEAILEGTLAARDLQVTKIRG
jgi:2,4-dienoyl-CoA reductase-like NADH-dependent reductase (Old Yellow Enzyme family)/thioredoxin reductase